MQPALCPLQLTLSGSSRLDAVKTMRSLENLIPENENPLYARTRSLIKDFVDQVEQDFDAVRRGRIYEAAELGFRLHITQGKRLDGQPYVNHLLDVALNLMRIMKVREADCVIAALLHDVVEDQASALLKAEKGREVPAASYHQLRKEALECIEERFGAVVSGLVDKLTNPDFGSMAKELKENGGRLARLPEQKIRHRFYKQHVVELGESKDRLGQYAFAVKMADFFDNALRHADLPVGTEEERLMKDKLEDKRGSLFVYLEKALPRLDISHPLYAVRNELVMIIGECYDRAYLRMNFFDTFRSKTGKT